MQEIKDSNYILNPYSLWWPNLIFTLSDVDASTSEDLHWKQIGSLIVRQWNEYTFEYWKSLSLDGAWVKVCAKIHRYKCI